MNSGRLLERFLRYTQIDTSARTDTENYPSSTGQLELGRMLVAEFHGMGLTNARQDRYGIVTATLPANLPAASTGPRLPTVALCSHLDTSPETSGAGVKPHVLRDYPGGDIAFGGDPSRVIRVADNPELEKMRGRTLITTDGTTLLGADDKAGVAILMETAAWLIEHPEIPHGPLLICFTCDEEIGRGVDKLRVAKKVDSSSQTSVLSGGPRNADDSLPCGNPANDNLDLQEIDAAACYTLDGHGSDEIDVETFSADQALVTVQGVNIHPSIAKGRMTNAIRAAAALIAVLPVDRLSPETTEGRQGFLHPYEIEGGVAEARIKILLRDFDAAQLVAYADRLRDAALEVKKNFPEVKIDVAIQRQYRNMADGLATEPRAVAYAKKALRRLGRTATCTVVRGGTDGSRLTELGLPTPNLSCGGHNPHSPLEWACLEEMVESLEWLTALVQVWAEAGDEPKKP
jgi:tripeptide aminopeptidase